MNDLPIGGYDHGYDDDAVLRDELAAEEAMEATGLDPLHTVLGENFPEAVRPHRSQDVPISVYGVEDDFPHTVQCHSEITGSFSIRCQRVGGGGRELVIYLSDDTLLESVTVVTTDGDSHGVA